MTISPNKISAINDCIEEVGVVDTDVVTIIVVDDETESFVLLDDKVSFAVDFVVIFVVVVSCVKVLL